MAVNKIDPKVIFASEAPTQDTPAVFTNKTVGWGESRKNGGRPTIKQMNALQQETDLKVLWLNENSVTPFDATIDYPINAVTIKDGAFKIFNGSVWNLFLSKSSVGLSNVDNTSDVNKPVSTATVSALNLKADKATTYTRVEVDTAISAGPYLADKVIDGNQTQDQINLYGGKKYDMPVGGYPLDSRVLLNSGNIVRSTITNNTNDPNINLTGWLPTNSTLNIFSPDGKSQQEINDAQEQRNIDEINARDWGILPENSASLNYTNMFNLLNAYPEREALDIFLPPGDYSFSQGFFITRPHKIRGVGAGEQCKTILDFDGATTVGTPNYQAALFIAHNGVFDDTSPDGAVLPSGQVGNVATGAVLENIKVINSSAHGIIKNAPSHCLGVAALNNAKTGILTAANVNESFTFFGGRISGIANSGSNVRCAAVYNGENGIMEVGDDANVINNTNCNSAYNGWFGFYDASLLGGLKSGCEAHFNTFGDYCQQGSTYDNSGLPETPSRSVFVGTYAEQFRPQAYSLNGRSLVIGSSGAQPPDTTINTLLSSILGIHTYKGFSVTKDIDHVQQGFGGNFVSTTPTELRMGVEGSDSHIKLTADGYTDRVKLMVDTFDNIIFFLNNLNNTLQKNRPYFPNGLTMGEFHLQSSGLSSPTSGTWDKGNIVWNEAPSAGGHAGWVCVTSGSPGVWKTFGAITA